MYEKTDPATVPHFDELRDLDIKIFMARHALRVARRTVDREHHAARLAELEAEHKAITATMTPTEIVRYNMVALGF